MKQWISALGVFLMVNGGCSPIVINPVDSQRLVEDEDAVTNALAMRLGDWTNPMYNEPGDVSTVYFQSDPDPDSLLLFLSDRDQECSQPLIHAAAENEENCYPTEPFWQALFLIPPELNRPGLIDLRDTRIQQYEINWGPVCGNGGSGFGPGLHPGTLEIVNSDATSVSVKLHMEQPRMGWATIDGDYTAMYCGVAPPVSPPETALAIRGESLTTIPNSDAEPEPDALYLFFETAAKSCQEPWSPAGCSTRHVTVKLPPSLQTPGIIDLTDPAIDAFFVRNEGYDCELSPQPFAGGTIEVLSIDASGASFRVYGSHTDMIEGSFNADGLYAASTCP